MAKFEKGKPRAKTAGRKKGTQNKITISAKEMIEKAVNELGGWEELAKWAKKNNRNQEKLYDWYFKMLPNSVVGAQDDKGDFHPLKVIIAKDGDGTN